MDGCTNDVCGMRIGFSLCECKSETMIVYKSIKYDDILYRHTICKLR